MEEETFVLNWLLSVDFQLPFYKSIGLGFDDDSILQRKRQAIAIKLNYQTRKPRPKTNIKIIYLPPFFFFLFPPV